MKEKSEILERAYTSLPVPGDKKKRTYKEMLIDNILKRQKDAKFTEEELNRKSVGTLEELHDNIGF